MKYADQIAIMMAVYNGESFLEEQLLSIINQTYKDWILYISDDHSSDSTAEIARKYTLKYPEKIILIENSVDIQGAKFNFNNALAHADRSKYFMFSDQDDYWMPNKIQVLMKEMNILESRFGENYPLLVYSDLEVVNYKLETLNSSFVKSSGSCLPEKNVMQQFLLHNCIPGCSMLFNSPLKKFAGPIPDQAYMHDWWVALVAACFGRICFVNMPLVKYRQHQGNTIGTYKKQSNLRRAVKILTTGKSRITVKNNKEMKNMRNAQTQILLDLYKRKFSAKQKSLIEGYIRALNVKKISSAIWAMNHGFIFMNRLYTIKFFTL